MPAALVPARLAFAADGTPFSETYGDVYHSAAGGLEQARHVFLAGNGLPGRWRGRRAFTVLETGFGFGLSFLATWQAWRDDAQRGDRLHFVSIEKHPFEARDLERLVRGLPFGNELAARWPLLVPGLHRLEFEDGRVVLTLALGDVADVLPQLQLAADAIYLDGFAPAKNPQMWEPRLLRHLGRVAAPGATLATWTVAVQVRTAVEGAGFALQKEEGFGGKREMLRGSLIPRKKAATAEAPGRSAVVVGAGMAGAAVAERLAARGWAVTVLERRAQPAMEASGNHAGVFHPIVSPDDSLFARFTRAAYLHLLRRWPALEGLAWDRCGVLQLARDERERASQARAIAALGYPGAYASLDAARGGLWFPQSGWVRPPSLVRALLARPGIDARFDANVDALSRDEAGWTAKDGAGRILAAAPVVVLANAADALRLAPQPHVRLREVRGQVTHLPAIRGLDHVVLKGGMALPGVDGISVVGASYDIDDRDPALRADSHAGNLERLAQILPGGVPPTDPAALGGRVGFRAVVRDRLPLAGTMNDAHGAGLFGAFAYGSRGLLWCGLAGELIASALEGEPLPVERDLAAAVAPGRFALRAARRGSG